jgi:hypothetical protein
LAEDQSFVSDMLISSNNSSNVITASRFDESEVLLMTADGDGDGRWLMS